MRYEQGPVTVVAEGRTRLTCAACGAVFEIPFQHRCRVHGWTRAKTEPMPTIKSSKMNCIFTGIGLARNATRRL